MKVLELDMNPEFVAIELEALSEVIEDTKFVKSEQQKQNEKKLLNRGTVKFVGKKCDWLKPEDFVSFYKGASTTLTENGNEYHVIAESNVLAIIRYSK